KSGGKPCGTTSSATSTGRTTPRHLTGQAFPVYSAAPVPTEAPPQGKLVQASGSHMHHRVRPLTELADDRSKSPIHGLRLRTYGRSQRRPMMPPEALPALSNSRP